MNKRTFLKQASLFTGLSFLNWACNTGSKGVGHSQASASAPIKHKFLYWNNPDTKASDDELKTKFEKWANAGISLVFFEKTDERNFRLAKSFGIETHRWRWTMNCHDEKILKEHPEWYVVSREGKSCIDHPPYVDYYKFLCPSKPGVEDYLEEKAKEIVKLDFVDGLHLDYIRYPDVILPLDLWKNYNIVQKEELPEYDFCYCQDCQQNFEAQYGRKINEQYPSEDLSWKNFRYNNISRIVNNIKEAIVDFQKPLSAAVFPTPEVARRIVRQDWTSWNLDFVCPMIYHSFYQEKVEWIGDAVQQGVKGLCNKIPLYAGLYLPAFKSMQELELGIKIALEYQAHGVSIFGDLNDEHLELLSKIKNELA